MEKFRAQQRGGGGGGTGTNFRPTKQALTEHELFEAQQLIKSGVLPVEQYPTYDPEHGMLAVEETEEETEVELADVEPNFLRGQTRRSGRRDLEPVKIVKNPDGSLQRAALQQSTLAKERRELRQAQANQLIDSIPKDLNRPWEDPLPDAGERHFAQELRSINIMSQLEGAPEWKQKAENKTLSYGMLAVEETEEETEVELADVEPNFLRGQTRRSGRRDLEPVKIVKNPDGSLQRAALQQSTLAKERRELRQAQANQLIDSIPKDLNRPWEDPLPDAGERHFAQELRSINIMSQLEGAPEWKQKAENKTLSYGIISNRSIKEQRESLPIFRLKKELMSAIIDNQILVVIGESKLYMSDSVI